MTDQTPFVPPGGSPPSGSPPVPPPAYGPALQYGPPPQQPAPKPPRPKGVTAVIIVAIASGALLLVGIVVAGAIAATNLVTEAIGGNVPVFDEALGEDPLVTGDKASPVAVEPMECGGCFGADDLGFTIIETDELQAVGLTTMVEPWTDYTAHFDSEATFFKKSWRDATGDPDECFVTYPAAPIDILDDEIVDDGSIIAYTGTYSDDDEWSTLGQSVRLFPSDQDAMDYMAGVAGSIDACTHYRSGERDTYWEADVTPAPALNIPSSVAAIGWVETTELYSRYYSFDLQRGNMVIRTGLGTAEEISELEFRALMEHVALQLANITPTERVG
jgi:hypothetical protein